MKKMLAICLAIIAVFGAVLLQTSAEDPVFQAGFAQVDITPAEVGLPLAGYGTADRLHTDVESNLCVTAIAMTDKENTTALLISVDTYNASQVWSNGAKTAIVKAMAEIDVDMDVDRIYISATTTMSAPELIYSGTDPDMKTRVDAYKDQVVNACAEAAVAAYNDRTAVTMYHNHMDVSEAAAHSMTTAETTVNDGDPVTRYNFATHYEVKQGETVVGIAGSNFGPNSYINKSGYTATEVFEPNDNMGLLVFQPEDENADPIVLVNWSAKANISSSGTNMYGVLNNTKLSADYVGFFRDAMGVEVEGTRYRTAFFQGISGNISAFPLVGSLRNPDVMEDYPYTEEVDGELVNKTTSTITPQLYGQKLAALARHGLEHEEGDSHLHEADMDAPINNLKFRLAVEPDVPTATQVALVNLLKGTEVPAQAEENLDGEMAVYANAYEYLIAQWDTAKPLVVTALTEAGETELAEELNGMLKPAQLSGVATRMAHTVNANTTNFATDAVYCDATVLQLGKMIFTMAPVDLFDNYGIDGTYTWEEVGAHFVLGNTNGASGYLPNYDSFYYNESSDAYYTGTPNTLSTIFPAGAGETLMEAYINVRKTMTATTDDVDNQIRLQCECGGLAAGKTGHTCEIKEFRPWYDPDSLPVSGNYYMMTDVTLLQESRTSTADKSIDLNGHTIKRVVLPEMQLDEYGAEIPAGHYYVNTRMFALEKVGRLTITDTAGGGKIIRDISRLDEISLDEQKKIKNYGLLVVLIQESTGEFILYNGTLDATGQYAGGGACVGNLSTTATFTMYDGQLLGGISDGGAALYANGTNNLYGGDILGGEVKDTAVDEDDVAGKYGNVLLLSNGKLLLAGDTNISGGMWGEDQCNLVILNADSLTVDKDYEGTAYVSVTADDPNGIIMAWLENVPESTHDNFKVDNYPTYSVTLCNRKAVTIADIRTYCACGGKAVGEHGHECQDISWKPWPITYKNYLPDNDLGGNYYLLTDIELQAQKIISAEFHLDLNGHNVVHKVQPEEFIVDAEENPTVDTRVFYVGEGGKLAITDSTNTPGVVRRDLTLLTPEQIASINNYGLLILINQAAGSDCVLFEGILDGEGQATTGGGGCVANLSKNVWFRMYGGALKNGVAATGGCLYSAGPVELHGGEITGGKATGVNGAGGVAIVTLKANEEQGRLEDHVGRLNLCGDVNVTENKGNNDQPANILVSNGYKNFTIKDAFAGEIGIMLTAKPQHNLPVACGDGVDISGATITGDNYLAYNYSFTVGHDYVVLRMAAASMTVDGNTTYYSTLQDAFDAERQEKQVITLQRPVEEAELSIQQDTYLDLNGWNVTNTTFNANGNKLYVLDTQTDDYSITAGEKHYAYDEELGEYALTVGNGYGIMRGGVATTAQSAGEGYDVVLAGAEKPIDLYLKITENETDVSFHRLNLRFAGITIRIDSLKDGSNWPGLFYNSQFGGDEVIKRNITAYGVGMSAYEDEQMYTRDRSYTTVDAANWLVGADKDGNSNNMENGTVLTAIMKTTYTGIINRRNSARSIRGQNYVILNDETRVVGPEISYSLKDVFEGNGVTGVDALWSRWDASTKTNILALYNKFKPIMKTWNIPNIKKAAA